VHSTDRITLSQKERAVRKVLHGVLQGERTQAEAARLLGFTTRHIRRLQCRLGAEEGWHVLPQTLRRWLIEEGLWQRRRDPHRSRQPRRACFGELVQMDASIHDWLEGRASVAETAASGVPPTAGRSGRTPAESYPPDGKADGTKKGRRRPAEDHPWRKPYQRRK
jgi:hypothetical protein